MDGAESTQLRPEERQQGRAPLHRSGHRCKAPAGSPAFHLLPVTGTVHMARAKEDRSAAWARGRSGSALGTALWEGRPWKQAPAIPFSSFLRLLCKFKITYTEVIFYTVSQSFSCYLMPTKQRSRGLSSLSCWLVSYRVKTA